eukprot:12015090-Prorocentrum_lima.AAC.1
MTSSLVGSEMCIRDSVNTVREGRRGGSHGMGWRGQVCGGLLRACRHQPHCLLYTSDAADDM